MSKGSHYDYKSRRFEDVSIWTQHTKIMASKILSVIKDQNPKIFVELGTFQGGITLAVHEKFPELEIYTFDRKNYSGDEIRKRIFGNNVHFFYGDILRLSQEEKKLPEGKKKTYFENDIDQAETVIEILRNEQGKILLYCDNGKKVDEINMFSKYLKIGDILGCHDWLAEVFPELIVEGIKDFKVLEGWPENDLSRFWIKVR